MCLHLSLGSLNLFVVVVFWPIDDRFPEYGKVEFVFSFGPERINGKYPFLILILKIKEASNIYCTKKCTC